MNIFDSDRIKTADKLSSIRSLALRSWSSFKDPHRPLDNFNYSTNSRRPLNWTGTKLYGYRLCRNLQTVGETVYSRSCDYLKWAKAIWLLLLMLMKLSYHVPVVLNSSQIHEFDFVVNCWSDLCMCVFVYTVHYYVWNYQERRRSNSSMFRDMHTCCATPARYIKLVNNCLISCILGFSQQSIASNT